jgi:hypothetical protein
MSPPPVGEAKTPSEQPEKSTARPTRITGWQPPKEESKPIITGWQPPPEPPILTRRSRSVSTAATDAPGSTSTSKPKGAEKVARRRNPRAPKAPKEETDITENVDVPEAKPSRKGKEKALMAVPEIIEVMDDGEEEDDDMPVFVGSAMAKKLASRFTNQKAPPISRSSSSRPPPPKIEVSEEKVKKPPAKRRTKAEMEAARAGVKVVIAPKLAKKDEDDAGPKWNLLPPVEDERGPVPVPQWLGKVQVLKSLPNCPVGMCTWKAKEKSGQGRWVNLSRSKYVSMLICC